MKMVNEGWGPRLVLIPNMPQYCEHDIRFTEPCRECKRGRWRPKGETHERLSYRDWAAKQLKGKQNAEVPQEANHD